MRGAAEGGGEGVGSQGVESEMKGFGGVEGHGGGGRGGVTSKTEGGIKEGRGDTHRDGGKADEPTRSEGHTEHAHTHAQRQTQRDRIAGGGHRDTNADDKGGGACGVGMVDVAAFLSRYRVQVIMSSGQVGGSGRWRWRERGGGRERGRERESARARKRERGGEREREGKGGGETERAREMALGSGMTCFGSGMREV